MFNFFHRLLRRNQPKTGLPAAEPAPPRATSHAGDAPQATADAADTPDTSDTSNASDTPTRRGFVCREPILDRQERIAGYAFDLHAKLQLRLRLQQDPTARRAYDDALLRNLTALDVHGLLGHRLAFVHLSPASLGHPLIERLAAQNTVLMLTLEASAMPAPTALQAQLDALRQRGLAHGWLLQKVHLKDHPGLLDLAAQADYVQFQTGEFDGLEIKTLIKMLDAARPAGRARLQLIAHELASFDEFNLCFQGGFDYFLGDFITRRDNWHPPRSDINRLLVIKLLNLLRSDTELSVIAPQLIGDPVMSFKLLRYLNSSAMGLQSPITAMDKALLVLGRSRFYRWLSLLLFDIKSPGYRERMLIEQALTRAFFLEALAGQGQLPKDGDELFLLGLFSMLDLLIGQPLPNILDQARLPPAVHAALLGEPGIHRSALELAIAAEDPHSTTLEQHSAACGLDAAQITRYGVTALTRAHEITTLSESA
ncbi:putative signal transduction protein [Sterolibacterium denitrificans]|uniref:Signal transduction protein n=3 Tax=Sterolibacterium denitrificans TaxID=157592 RepID=A0A7Z7HT42_9PROT|nr:HDOD domain-containing protein [Sterolibacterium denitrificans]KYC29160.1 hypothetical protein ACY05_00870 [Sterolibacterium denitrificans]SMB29351.1 putative signal transduction protein [Sterolibacterium denitrificans]